MKKHKVLYIDEDASLWKPRIYRMPVMYFLSLFPVTDLRIMINRYAAEIHINTIRFLRNDDFNNNGHIEDIATTLKEAMELNKKINNRLGDLYAWLHAGNLKGGLQFYYADGGYISMKGASDAQLLELESKGLIELFDFATDKNWVKKYGHQFGLIWEDGRAIKI